jgi:ribosomal protein L37AE/L43A
MLYGDECECGNEIDIRRIEIGYTTCLACGDKQAKQKKFVVQIPYGKGAYQYIHNPIEDLKYTNPKRT